MIISFAWTTPALISGHKTMTRRDWKAAHAAKFHAGDLVDAWDRSPRTGKGRKVATIRITREPYKSWIGTLTVEDYRREGFEWLRANGSVESVDRIVTDWGAHPEREFWVVKFELVEVVR